MEFVKAPAPKPHLDLLRCHALGKELPPGHDAVLLGGKSRNEAVRPSSEGLWVHMTPNPTFDVGAPQEGRTVEAHPLVASASGARRLSTSRRSRTGSCAGLGGDPPGGRLRSAPAGRGGRRAGSRPFWRCSPPSACRRGRSRPSGGSPWPHPGPSSPSSPGGS